MQSAFDTVTTVPHVERSMRQRRYSFSSFLFLTRVRDSTEFTKLPWQLVLATTRIPPHLYDIPWENKLNAANESCAQSEQV